MSLKILNLNKSFVEKTIFNDFSFNFPKTGKCIITGSSGIGKTTLLRIISGLDLDFSGKIENGGIGNVSYMFQEYRLFPMLSALKNVVAVTDETAEDEAAAAKLLLRLGLSDNDLKKKPAELSGGMKQRVAFARAVTAQKPILILDEPTKELDDATAKILGEIINEEAAKRLVIVVTHDDISDILDNSITINLQ